MDGFLCTLLSVACTRVLLFEGVLGFIRCNSCVPRLIFQLIEVDVIFFGGFSGCLGFL